MAMIPGSYEISMAGRRAFVPNPLPPEMNLTPEALRQIEEATYLLGQVEMCRTLLPNTHLLIYSSLQREAIASSTIEGTIASADELVLFQAVQQADRQAVREVANYVEALDWGYQQLPEWPITTRLILGLHERLMREVRGQGSAGRFKEMQNYIASHRLAPIEEAIFVPPPPEKVGELMGALEQYINLDNTEPKVAQCALVHYQFETIHPFGDGNGRVGRLLIILHLMRLGLLSAPLVHPSVYFERTRDEYNQRLQDVRDNGQWNEWIGYFANAIAQQSRETIGFVRVVLDLQQQLRNDIANVRRRASAQEVIEAFFQHPVLSPTDIVERTTLSFNTVNSTILELEEQGVLREITGRKKGRMYACQPILRAIFANGEDQPVRA